MVKKYLALATAAVLTMTMFLGACESTGGKNSRNDVQLSEVMAKNNGVLADNDEEYPDWIELHNPTDQSISLKDYGLTDDPKKKGKYIFPDITLQPGEYFVVYASGKNTTDIENRIVHLPYSINSDREDIMLYDPHGRELGHIALENLQENMTCGLDDKGNTVYFARPTPGAANAETIPHEKPGTGVPASDATIRINEYSTDSTVTLADEDGDFVSWVELHNYGEAPLNLSAFTLSDDPAKPDKWTFPAVTVPAGGYQIVYLSDKSKAYADGGPLHASFVLSGKESVISLYAGDGKLADELPVYELTANLTYGRTANDPEKTQFFAKATPGAANTLPGFDSIDSAKYPKNKDAVISEAASVNRTGPTASDKQRYDYLELHNPTDKPVSLNGYRLSDKKDPSRWQTLPEITLQPGEYKVIYCADEAKVNQKTGEVFLKLGLNRYGEKLYLIDPNGVVVDDFQLGRLDDGYACGLVSDTDPKVYYFTSMTPGAVNPSQGLGGPAPTPVFSRSTGYANNGDTVEIQAPGCTIRYTTDGSEPTASSPVYSGAVAVGGTVTIRARAFMDGRLPSDDASVSLIVGRVHDMPVIFLSTDDANLYDYNTGIFADGPGKSATFPFKGANFWKDWERPIHFEYMDEKGNAQVQFNAGIKVFGQYSRALDQKSFSINLRDKYGPTEVCYPFFKNNDINVFSAFVLRSSGQDNTSAHIRDAFCAMAVKGQMDLDIMDYRPVVVYINGKYNGIYDLREKIDEDYTANHHGTDSDNLDMIKGTYTVMSGNTVEYKELLNYVKIHDLTVQENYEYICSVVDVQEMMNWWIVESFFNNTDTGNIKFYKERGEGHKWRWVLFDLDWAMSPSTYQWNMVEEIVNPSGHGVGRNFDTSLMVGLMKNKTFRETFISTYGKYLKTTFATDRLLTLYDQMVAEIDTEMPYHMERWAKSGSTTAPRGYDSWKRSCATLRNIVSKKNDLTRQAVIDTFTKSKYTRAYHMSESAVIALLDGE